MAVMRESWTDERLDDFRAETARRFGTLEGQMRDGFDRVDARFEQVDARFERIDARFDRVDDRFERIELRLDAVQRSIVFAAVAMSGAFIAGFAALVGLVATQL
jgi:hypothetical protein